MSFEEDVIETEEFVIKFLRHLLTDRGKREAKLIAKNIRTLYPSYNIREAISKYYDDYVMGGITKNIKEQS